MGKKRLLRLLLLLFLTLAAVGEWCWIAGWTPVSAVAQSPEKLPETLHRAARENDPVTVLLVLRSGISPDVRDGFQQTPLLIASASGAFEVTRVLLDAGADCNLADDRGMTPLGAAAAADAGAIAELLLVHGAALNPLPPRRSPLDLARKHGNQQLADFLIANGAVASF